MKQNDIANIYVLGLGAIGSIYAAKLYDMNPESLKIIADSRRIDAYQRSGTIINGKPYHFNYISPGEDQKPADLIIIAVKYLSLQQAIQDISGFVGENTIVISLLNGISSEDVIGQEIGPQHLLYAYTTATGMPRGVQDPAKQAIDIGRIVFGEKNNETISARVTAVKNLFERADIPYHIPSNMIKSQWSKFMMNTGISQASTILKATYATFQQPTEARTLMLMAAAEVVSISQKCGVNLDQSDLDEFIVRVNALNASSKTSMLQDMEAGRKTEIEIFSGAVINMGKKYNVPTPVNETMYLIIQSMERNLRESKKY